MANRLRILEASPPGLDAPPPSSLRVALVNMPFSSINYPSIQLGLLQAIVARHGLEAKSHYLNIRFGARIGWDHYEEVCHGFGAYLLGDWIFARAAFGDEAPPAERYLEAFDAEVSEVCARMRCGRDRLMRLREEEAPAFIEACLEEIPWGEYDVIGFSSMFAQHCAVLAMARRIKSRHPNAIIVLGGANVDGEAGREFARAIPWIDYVVLGEGDHSFVALLARIAGGDRTPEPPLPGVAHARGGEVVYGGQAPLVRDLDALPYPDYDDYFTTALAVDMPPTAWGTQVLLPYESARGCWWGEKHHCTFCGLNNATMTFRRKSAARVVSELNGLAGRYGLYEFVATESILDYRETEAVFEALHADRTDYSVFCFVKSNLTPAELRVLSRGGVRFVQPGIESLSTRVLDLMDKGITGVLNVRFLKWAHYYKMGIGWHVLRGFPGEQIEDYEGQLATMRLIPHLPPPCNVTQRVRLERYSPNYRRAAEIGFVNVRPNPAYESIYPAYVAPDRIAYAFVSDTPTTLPDEAHREADDFIRKWRAAWESPRRPSLVYERGHDRVTITDARDPEAPRVHAARGLDALVYEQCNTAPRTVAEIAERLGDARGAAGDIEGALDRWKRLGLVLEENGRHLSLALPVNRSW